MPRLHATRRRLAGLTPFLLALGALPLLAPTCGDGQPGVKTFSRSSIIIPMDVCYQSQGDQVQTSYTPAECPQGTDPGDVIRAYGLVYQLIRNGVAVYWIIDPSKDALQDVDLSIQYGGGPPVLRYDWSTGLASGAPTSGDLVNYRGGPFVVDGSDFARASRILQDHFATFSGLVSTVPPTNGVNVHVSNVAFSAPVAKTMAGGWSAGGAVPPKLALLDIGSSGAGAKNSEIVIRGYLQRAGLDTAGASGTATGTHGQIYDRLVMEDFLPDASGRSNLEKNGYQVLWVPHWAAPSSCSDCPPSTSCTCQNKYPAATIDTALRNIGAFSARGGDVFAECAGIGSFEGVFGASTTSFNAVYEDGDASTHFQTIAPAGVWITTTTPAGAYYWSGNFSSPFLQLGDYPFFPRSGAIATYRANAASAYRSETARFVSSSAGDHSADVFTIVPRSAAHGTVVYLGGHSYSGNDGLFAIAGTRLVLNTLFNLGAGCSASGVACSTGLLGVCAQGTMQCDPQTQQPVCAATTLPTSEACDGLDNDCNGLVDDGLSLACYGGPPTSLGADGKPRGTCRSGVTSCERRADGSYGFTACQNEVLPAAEVCNGLDDDCDGATDGLQQACYTGPADTIDPATGLPRFACRRGTQTCTGAAWGACDGEQGPTLEACGDGGGNGVDENCNGLIDEGCTCGVPGTERTCYSGPSGTNGQGACRGGTQTCSSTGWGACLGETTPGPELCGNGQDDDCNGRVDDAALCDTCPPPGDASLVCRVTNPDGSAVARDGSGAPAGECRDGARSCTKSVFGACTGVIAPIPEICDAKDNDCDGTADEDVSCGAGRRCLAGVCVPTACGAGSEQRCPEGYDCVGETCVQGSCGGTTCAAGLACFFGNCLSPCDGVACGAGASCASGECTAGSCYFTGCDPGQICRGGACVVDACDGVRCPTGTFCRLGDCVQSCAFQTCAAGQRCSTDGFCEPDACAGVACAPGLRCSGGACAPDPCANLSCGQGLSCKDGRCVDDPCAGIDCPAGTCSGGQCYSVASLVGTAAPPPAAEEPAGGCGCGAGQASPLVLALLALALPLARRGPRRRGLPGAALLLCASLFGAACSEEKPDPVPFDATACAETCGEERCVDVASDPGHCGGCGSTCAAGETCVTGRCGATAPVAPYLRALAPSSGGKGATNLPVDLAGERFTAGSSVRTKSPSATRTYPPCAAGQQVACVAVSDAAHARVFLDLGDSPTTQLEVRLVTAQNVISNAAVFGVTTPSPTITEDLVPPRARIDALATVLVVGTGLTETSQCHIASASCRTDPAVCPFPDVALPSTLVPEGLRCTLDPSLQPGTYDVWVVNEGTLASTPRPFAVDSAVPQIVALTPNSGEAEKIVSFSIVGTGFDGATTVSYTPSGGAATTVSHVAHYGPTEIAVTQLLLPPCAGSCTDKVQVRNLAGASNEVAFFRGAAPPQVLSLTVTPQPLYQGGTATLRFTGASIPPGTTIEVRPPVGAALAVTPTSVLAGEVVGSLPLASQPEGLYAANLKFPSGGASSSFQFRVFSNAAVLFSATPSGAPQGTTVAVTVTGSNLQEGALLRLSSGATVYQNAATTYTPPDRLTATALRAAGAGDVSLDTGVYQLQVVNPGAAPSNGLSFSVSPGLPTVTGVSPASATRQNALVPVTLTGTNFAKPDATGGGASAVMVTSSLMPGFANGPCPAPPLAPAQFVPVPGTVTVNGSTRITVQLDTLSAVALAGGTTYYVAVWNPGGNPPPQKSNGCTPLASLPSFTILP